MRRVSLIVLIIGSLFLAKGVLIHAKARLAQVLLARAWNKTLEGQKEVKPWPWADTYPIARLSIPAVDASFIVLSGSSGRTLTWGPGHIDGTALPGADGNCVISAHRDTHFAVLRDLPHGQSILLETADGTRHRYLVEATKILHERRTEALRSSDRKQLTLITCYPFHAAHPRGPLRYVVTARAAPRSLRAKPQTGARSTLNGEFREAISRFVSHRHPERSEGSQNAKLSHSEILRRSAQRP